MAKEVNPAAVFDRLFGAGDAAEQTASRARRDRYHNSILDFVLEDAGDLRRKLGTGDQRKLDEYLFAVRDIERRMDQADKLTGREDGVPDFPRPAGVPRAFDEHLKQMFDVMTLAFLTDSTRIITFMYTNAGSNRNYKDIGVAEGHHDLSHHGNDKEKLEKIATINHYHTQQLAYLLKRLDSIPEGDGTLLDNCMLMYGSGLGDGNRHNHDNLPIALFGSGGGTIATGRHIKYKRDTPLTNLYVSMLDRVGASVETFSDSTGPLDKLDL
jgi:hypothetical protein